MFSRVLLGGVFILFVGVLGYAYVTLPPRTTLPTNSNSSSGYTLEMIAAHSSASSCWAAINGNVYNLTNWIHQHPGGPEDILSICGTDASEAFNAQHGGERQPAQELTNFYIGALSQ